MRLWGSKAPRRSSTSQNEFKAGLMSSHASSATQAALISTKGWTILLLLLLNLLLLLLSRHFRCHPTSSRPITLTWCSTRRSSRAMRRISLTSCRTYLATRIRIPTTNIRVTSVTRHNLARPRQCQLPPARSFEAMGMSLIRGTKEAISRIPRLPNQCPHSGKE